MTPEQMVALAEKFDPKPYLIKLPRRQKGEDGQWRNVGVEYLQVQDRLLWLRTDYPAAHVHTELIEHDAAAQTAVFKATVTIEGRGSATGWGTSSAAAWDKGYVERSETKALGRALAALGFGTQFCGDDFDEGQGEDGAKQVVDAPRTQRQTTTPGTTRITTPQGAQALAGTTKLQAPADDEPPLPSDPQYAGPKADPPAGRGSAQQSAPTSRGSTTSGGNGASGGWTDRPATEPQVKAIYSIARGAQAMDDATIEEWTAKRYGCKPAELSRRQASEMIDALRLGTANA